MSSSRDSSHSTAISSTSHENCYIIKTTATRRRRVAVVEAATALSSTTSSLLLQDEEDVLLFIPHVPGAALQCRRHPLFGYFEIDVAGNDVDG
jgi:hypothetical protein